MSSPGWPGPYSSPRQTTTRVIACIYLQGPTLGSLPHTPHAAELSCLSLCFQVVICGTSVPYGSTRCAPCRVEPYRGRATRAPPHWTDRLQPLQPWSSSMSDSPARSPASPTHRAPPMQTGKGGSFLFRSSLPLTCRYCIARLHLQQVMIPADSTLPGRVASNDPASTPSTASRPHC